MNVSVENICCELWRTQYCMIARYGRDRYWVKFGVSWKDIMCSYPSGLAATVWEPTEKLNFFTHF